MKSSEENGRIELTMKPMSEKVAIGKIVVPENWENKPVYKIISFNKQTNFQYLFFEGQNHPL
jgi:hypothetical protein